MRVLKAVIAVMAMGATPAMSQPVSPGGAWTAPTAENMGDYYPRQAERDKVDGSATIDCAIKLDGALAACDVVSETPLGYGFGKATAKMFLKHCWVESEVR